MNVMQGGLLPVLVLFTSLLAAAMIFIIPEHKAALRNTVNLTAAGLKLMLVMWMAVHVLAETDYEFRFAIVTGLEFILRVDALALMLVGLSSLLWLFTTIYAIGYLEGGPNRSRFFGFFSLCVASTVGIALAGTAVTIYARLDDWNRGRR